MADSKQDIVLEWLRDAHSKGQQAQYLYEKQADRMEDYPQLQARFNEFKETASHHQTMLEEAIERLGGSPSVLKDVGGKIMAWGQSISGAAMSDEVVKGVMFCYTFQQMGIAAYRILTVAAKEAGDEATARLSEEIRQQDAKMGEWLYEIMPEVTRTYMAREFHSDQRAKR